MIDVRRPEPNLPSPPSASPSIVRELGRDGTARINSASVPPGELSARLRAVYDGRPDKVLFVKADPHPRYAAVVDAMDVARGAGVKVIGWP